MTVPTSGAELRRLRHLLALSQEDLASELGVTQAAVSQMESECRPISRRTALLLRRFLERRVTAATGP